MILAMSDLGGAMTTIAAFSATAGCGESSAKPGTTAAASAAPANKIAMRLRNSELRRSEASAPAQARQCLGVAQIPDSGRIAAPQKRRGQVTHDAPKS